MKIAAVALVILIVSPVQPSAGRIVWDACGHQAVAAIAFKQVGDVTETKVTAIFKADPRRRKFIDAAKWPDDIKQGLRNDLERKAPENRPWHYVNIDYFASEQKIQSALENNGQKVKLSKPDSANVVTAIKYYTAFLKSGKGSSVQKADALSWLIHLVGDVHQPLHCIEVETASDKKLNNYTPPASGDLGGNGFKIEEPAGNLHAFWDDMFDEPTGGPHGEGSDHSVSHAKAVAKKLELKLDEVATPDMLSKEDPADWARESYAFREFIYSPPLAAGATASQPVHALSSDYMKNAKSIAEKRVVLAGARLARLLDSIFGDE